MFIPALEPILTQTGLPVQVPVRGPSANFIYTNSAVSQRSGLTCLNSGAMLLKIVFDWDVLKENGPNYFLYGQEAMLKKML